MESYIKLKIVIETSTNDERDEIGKSIHKQLRGNKDYIDNNIILNIDDDRKVRLWIFDECVDIPSITI